MGLREKLHQYISDNIALFDCSGDCPDEVAINNDLRTPEYCDKCFADRIIALVKKNLEEGFDDWFRKQTS